MASTLTLRFLNSFVILAIAPSSVVQTGVKSLGCEKRMPQPPPSHSWKLTVPSVVSAVKFGASSPNRSAMTLSFLSVKSLRSIEERIDFGQAVTPRILLPSLMFNRAVLECQEFPENVRILHGGDQFLAGSSLKYGWYNSCDPDQPRGR